MKRRFKKKLKFKKNVVILTKMFFISLLIIYMFHSRFLKQYISKKGDKYILNSYIKKYEKPSVLASKITKTNNDEIFMVNEHKDVKPLIYIYNTHQSEKYLPGNSLYTPNIIYASKYLGELLNKNNLPTIIESRSINDVLNKNGWSYGSSYKVSRLYMEDAYNENNTLKYFFDIHRDAGSYEYTTLCVNEKCYAKILFLIGLENPTYIENQKYAEELNKRLNQRVNGISKGILQKQGKKVNGIYNQDFSPRVILIEIGGENNTIDEVYNTISVLSDVLIEYIKEENNYGI